jgi:hypothetical protein
MQFTSCAYGNQGQTGVALDFRRHNPDISHSYSPFKMIREMANTKDLSEMNHYLAYTPLHFYYEIDKDGNQVLRHIRVQQRTFEVPADGITIDVVPPNSVGSEQIEDESVMMDDLHPEVKDSIADRVTKDELDNFHV